MDTYFNNALFLVKQILDLQTCKLWRKANIATMPKQGC